MVISEPLMGVSFEAVTGTAGEGFPLASHQRKEIEAEGYARVRPVLRTVL